MNDRRGQRTLRRLRGLEDIRLGLMQTGHWKFFAEGEEAQPDRGATLFLTAGTARQGFWRGIGAPTWMGIAAVPLI